MISTQGRSVSTVQQAIDEADKLLPLIRGLRPGSEFKKGHCLELVARRAGYDTWRAYRKVLERRENGPDRHHCTVSLVHTKGGVGVTSFAYDLVRYYEKSGLEVLVIENSGGHGSKIAMWKKINEDAGVPGFSLMSEEEYNQAVVAGDEESLNRLNAFDLVLCAVSLRGVSDPRLPCLVNSDLIVTPVPYPGSGFEPYGLADTHEVISEAGLENKWRVLLNRVSPSPNHVTNEVWDYIPRGKREKCSEEMRFHANSERQHFSDLQSKNYKFLQSFMTVAYDWEEDFLYDQGLTSFNAPALRSHVDTSPKSISAFEIAGVALEIAQVVGLDMTKKPKG